MLVSEPIFRQEALRGRRGKVRVVSSDNISGDVVLLDEQSKPPVENPRTAELEARALQGDRAHCLLRALFLALYSCRPVAAIACSSATTTWSFDSTSVPRIFPIA